MLAYYKMLDWNPVLCLVFSRSHRCVLISLGVLTKWRQPTSIHLHFYRIVISELQIGTVFTLL
jgi:hypothetical protein